MQDPDKKGHGTEWVSYIVVEAGRNMLEGGIIVEAGTKSTSIIHRGGQSFKGDSVKFSEPFKGPPVILHSLNTYNTRDFMTSMATDVKKEDFQVAMEAAETGKTSTFEYVGWIAFSPATGSTNGDAFIIGTGKDGTFDGKGLFNSPHDIDLSSAGFNGSPDMVVSVLNPTGSDGSWARGAGGWNTVKQEVLAEEDQISDQERKHIDEQFSWAAFTANTDLIGTAENMVFEEGKKEKIKKEKDKKERYKKEKVKKNIFSNQDYRKSAKSKRI
mmetsp:Transcript_8293/g.10921  ORF Transcript_8293/g.10921 Transcript_8293/m.10921 type:complete len:271 (-) Transcript_8293:100-912(-)